MPVNIQISVKIDNESIMLLERLCLKTQSAQYNTGNRYSGNRYSGNSYTKNNYTSNSYIGNNYTSNSYSETSYSGNSSVQTKSLFDF
jgi:uncharacterized membrane protein